MKRNVDRWANLVAVLVLLLSWTAMTAACGDDDDDDNDTNLPPIEDDDNDTTEDDDATDDDDNDDDDNDDNDTPPECDDPEDCDDGLYCTGAEDCPAGQCVAGEAPCIGLEVCDEDNDRCLVPENLLISPSGNALPAATTHEFMATLFYDDGSTIVDPEGLTWATGDENVATVADGTVTGVADGGTTLTASLDDGRKTVFADTVDLFVGADVYIMDGMGAFGTIDRVQHTYLADYFAADASLAGVPYDLIFADGFGYLVDSGDYGPGISGAEKVVEIDLLAGLTRDIALNMDSPWSATVYDGALWVTANLSDQLARIDLIEEKDTTYLDLPADCVPTSLTGAAGKIYVACSGYTSKGYLDGKIVTVDTATHNLGEIALTTVNPGIIVATEDESKVYVAAIGDYTTAPGAVFRIDTATDAAVNTITFTKTLGNAALGPDGKLWILGGGFSSSAIHAIGELYAIDTTDNDAFLRGEDNPILLGDAGVGWYADILAHPDVAEVYICYQDWSSFIFAVKVIAADDYTDVYTYDVSIDFLMPQNLASW